MAGWLDESEDETTEDAAAETEETPLPYLDPGVAAELEDQTVPEWMGRRWRDIAVEDQTEAWVTLRRWVDWFTNEYRLPASAVPECWFRHSEIRAELYAAMCFEQKVWDAEAPTMAPSMYWQAQLPEIRRRLTEMTTATTCIEGKHEDKPALVRTVDEDLWTATMSARRDERKVPRPAEGTRYVRAVLEDMDGKTLVTTKPVGVQSASEDQTPVPELSFSVTRGDADEVAELRVSQGHAVAWVTWQESTDQQDWKDLEQDSETE